MRWTLFEFETTVPVLITDDLAETFLSILKTEADVTPIARYAMEQGHLDPSGTTVDSPYTTVLQVGDFQLNFPTDRYDDLVIALEQQTRARPEMVAISMNDKYLVVVSPDVYVALCDLLEQEKANFLKYQSECRKITLDSIADGSYVISPKVIPEA